MRLLFGLTLLWLAGLAPAVHGPTPPDRLEGVRRSVAGKLLVASEELADPNFDHTVVFVVLHDEKGALGLVINRSYGRVPARELLARLGLPGEDATGEIELAYGGPVDPATGFVLHSPDYRLEDTLVVTPEFAVTNDTRIMADIARGKGPARYIATLGYAGWAAGQLDAEIARGDWEVVDADPELVFETPAAERWERAKERVGVDL
ncbi:MAG TPA: hypothetical protein ENJ83_05010 [Rhodospirillales bacterium]|nr:hypothetical protein [Rhodospirillales bacterium]